MTDETTVRREGRPFSRLTLYPRLAFTNIRKNRSTYLPFMLSSITMISLFYILFTIAVQSENSQYYGDATMTTILHLGLIVTGIIAVFSIFYTNSFLMKRRKKEFGLYSVLGMEKKHIGRVLFFEILFVGLFSIAAGLLAGILLSKLVYLLFLNLLHMKTVFAFAIYFEPIAITALMFLGVFLGIILFNFLQIHTVNPARLLLGSRQGEKEPKAKWIFTVFGVITLGIGYAIALSVQHAVEAIALFFIAVIFVIIGTYLLFTAGSIALCKVLKKNKAYYYKKEHFISVSGMIYRMKQNAAGLAGICILSTCVLVVLSSTVSLYLGMDDMLKQRFPQDVTTCFYNTTPEEEEGVAQAVQSLAQKYEVGVQNVISYHSLSHSLYYSQDGGITAVRPAGDASYRYLYPIEILSLDDYRRLTGYEGQLNEGEMLFWTTMQYTDRSLRFLGEEYLIKDYIDKPEFVSDFGENEAVTIILPDDHVLNEIRQDMERAVGKNSDVVLTYNYRFNLTGSERNKQLFGENLRGALLERVEHVATVTDVYTSREGFYTLYGSLFFVGIFIGLLFMIATVLIIYYKQISEGYDDKERFVIMQKVGMDKDEVRKAIRSQILTVFYLPLVGAVIHIGVAFNIIGKMLAGIGLTNTALYFAGTCGTVIVFALGYHIVYGLTAKAYYRIVNA